MRPFDERTFTQAVVAHDSPVARTLPALGRHAWRPAHLHFMISAPRTFEFVRNAARGDKP